MSIKGNWRRHGSEVFIRWCQRFFSSPLRDSPSRLRRSILSPPTREKTSGTQGITSYTNTRQSPMCTFIEDAPKICGNVFLIQYTLYTLQGKLSHTRNTGSKEKNRANMTTDGPKMA